MAEFEREDVNMETTESHLVNMICADCGHVWSPQFVVQHEADPATGETPSGGHPGNTVHSLGRSDVKKCPDCGSANIEVA